MKQGPCSPPPSPNRETCRRCGGTGLVDDGEITGSEGAEFENGPVKCVKDCPACATPSPDREQVGDTQVAMSRTCSAARTR